MLHNFAITNYLNNHCSCGKVLQYWFVPLDGLAPGVSLRCFTHGGARKDFLQLVVSRK